MVLVLTESGALSTSDASAVALFNGSVIAATSLIGFTIFFVIGWSDSTGKRSST